MATIRTFVKNQSILPAGSTIRASIENPKIPVNTGFYEVKNPISVKENNILKITTIEKNITINKIDNIIQSNNNNILKVSENKILKIN